ncbi:hypothetical protein ARMGADRAFT_101882 [Armillaria gallica]|uniref:Uncharacterized protein n=1 Tax=Armillaria gallica TaxID=47427 RepID=A0A2H3CSZ1_ARMGA|nr:hypothetical protein ARMGADRAFT_101882 [Armillaria gallica]
MTPTDSTYNLDILVARFAPRRRITPANKPTTLGNRLEGTKEGTGFYTDPIAILSRSASFSLPLPNLLWPSVWGDKLRSALLQGINSQ